MNPYLTIEGIAGLSFFAFCAFIVLRHIEKCKSFQTVDFTVLAMGLVYGLLFPIVVHGDNYHGAQFVRVSLNYTLLHTLAATIAVFSIFVGWHSVSHRKQERLAGFFFKVSSKQIIFWLYFMFLLAFFTQYLYNRDYGGFVGYFDYNRLIRSAMFDNFERSRFSFLLPFGGMAVLACYGFWGLIISRVRRASVWFGFFISFILSTYVLLASAGRVSMVVFVATILLSAVLLKRVNRLVIFFTVPVMILVSLVTLYFVSNILELKATDSVFVFILRESSYIFVSFFAQLNEGFLFNLFAELLLVPAYLAPSSLTGSWLWNASDLNTEIISGARKSVDGVTGSIPTDLITFGLMQFHFLGIIFYSFIFGYFLKVVSAVASSFSIHGLTAIFSAYVILRIGIVGVFYSYPQHIILGNFAPILVVLGVFAWRSLKMLILSSQRRARSL